MYVVGYPRSGNTWLCYLLAYSLNSEYDDLDDPGVHPRNVSQRKWVKGGLGHDSAQAQVGKVLKSHALHPGGTASEPVVYLVRDGRDVMVSYYHYSQRSGGWPGYWARSESAVQRLSRKLGLPRLVEGMRGSEFSSFARRYGIDWASHVDAGLGAQPQGVVRYEDLLANPKEALGTLFAELNVGVADETMDQAVELFSFRQLSGRQPGQEDAQSFFRKGTSGGWLEHFSEEDTRCFDRVAGSALRRLGYPSGGHATPDTLGSAELKHGGEGSS